MASPDDKQRRLNIHRVDPHEAALTTDQGIPIGETDNSLRVGERGPTLMEDFHLREKITHFDHERIPERVVHARGTGAYGYFQLYESLEDYTSAEFLRATSARTPVFVRFSTVAGSRGSADTVRDVRGFATRFYTRQGNFDIVGNNLPVFFIQDGIKFPDFVHAVKPEPHNEIPQASSAHDTLWDFVQLQPETTHMMMWMMSDRALPRSYRMMQGFGVHTFRFVDESGKSTFVKFHWKPRLGTHSLVWDEAQKIAGKDPDFHRRDLWEAIEAGDFPEWELGVQLVPQADQDRFDFDLLDATKIIPEEQVPVRPIGRMVLDRNPDNFFAEIEQVAFHLGNVVPGIDVTDDPLLQARLFSYLDTQLTRLGGPNFTQLPVNQPVADVRNHQVDGLHQTEISTSRATYHPNSLGGGCPAFAGNGGGYVHYPEHVAGDKIRKRSESFADHYSQATLFWNSMSDWEREHIVAAFRFELGKVEHRHIREGVVDNLNHVDHALAVAVAEGVGVHPPDTAVAENPGVRSPALSQVNTVHSPATRKIAILVADGVNSTDVETTWNALHDLGAQPEVIAPRDGLVTATDGAVVEATRALPTVGSVLYDAVLVPGGAESVRTLSLDGQAVHFVTEAYKHYKAIGAIREGSELLTAARVLPGDGGVLITDDPDGGFVKAYADAVATHRHYGRGTATIPA